MALSRGLTRFAIVVAIGLASNPTHALDLKKELERLMFSDCTGLCVKSGRSVRTFREMGFADLATSACTAYLDCYGGDDRKGVKVLPADDDFFDDDLYEVL